MSEQDFGRFDLVALLAQRWKTLVVFVAAGLACGIAYSLLAPAWYSATLTVVPSENSKDAAGIASKLPVALDALSPQTDVRRIHAVLVSRSVADEVIDRFNLQAHYGAEYREHARKMLGEHCSASVDRKSSVVSLTCEDKDPKLAMQMAAYFGEVGNRVFGRISASSAREERRFLETQVVKARQDVDKASQQLREFQERHKIIDLPEQSKAVISAMASIQGELLSKQLELSYLNSFSSRTESSVVQLERQIAIMKAKMGQLEAAQHASDASPAADKPSGSGTEFFPNAMAVPALRFELEQLIRQQKIQETVFFLLMQRFEMAKVDEARDTSTFQILDQPTLPTYRSRPRRRQVAAIGTVVGAAAAAAWILVPFWWQRRSRLPRA